MLEEELMAACGLFFRLFVFLVFFQVLAVSATDSIPANFLLPVEHPIKPVLDHIFSSSRALLSLESLEKAGFSFSKPRKFTNLIVARHPAIHGYIFKLYLDAQRYHKDKGEHFFWILRVQGSLLVRQQIIANNLQDFLKVPQKWIYALPKNPKPHKGYMRKNYILVEEDMDLISNEENKALWKSGYVSKELLDAVFLVLREVGLSDCAKPDNIPFSKDGRVAFIDTQTFGGSVPFNNLTSVLSEENQSYWKLIIQ